MKIRNIECVHDIYLAKNDLSELNNWWSLKKQIKPENTVWDEDKTIKENRKQTVEHNERINQEISRRQEAYFAARKELDNAVIEFIKSESSINITSNQAEYIWNWCKNNHSDDAHNWIHDALELVEEFMRRG